RNFPRSSPPKTRARPTCNATPWRRCAQSSPKRCPPAPRARRWPRSKPLPAPASPRRSTSRASSCASATRSMTPSASVSRRSRRAPACRPIESNRRGTGADRRAALAADTAFPRGEPQMTDTPNMPLNELESDAAAQPDAKPQSAKDLEAVYDIPVQVSAVLGRANMQVSQLLKLGRGAVVELDRKVGEAIDIYVNNRLVARGEVVIVDEHLGVTMTEIVKADRA